MVEEAAPNQWCIVDLGQINALLAPLCCPRCERTDTLHLASSTGDHLCFALKLRLSCTACDLQALETFSFPRSGPKGGFTINDLLVLFFTRIGLGHTAMRSFASVRGQKGLHLKTFQKKQHRVLDAFISAAEDILKESAAAVKAHLQETEGDTEDGIRDILLCTALVLRLRSQQVLFSTMSY